MVSVRVTWFAVALIALAGAVSAAAADTGHAGHQNTPGEADSALVVDWLFQANGKPTCQRVLFEVGRARGIAARLPKRDAATGPWDELRALERLDKDLRERTAAAGPDAPAKDLYLAVRRVKRRLLLSDPAVDVSRILCIDQPYPRDDHGDGRIARHGNSHRNGIKAVSGGKLLMLDGLHPQAGARSIGPEAAGAYWRPDLSFDGRRVLFCFKPRDHKAFHLYEVGLDGTGLRQLTDGDYDDIDPIYLPDGYIVFVTTRCHTYVRCMPHANAYVLARCDADGRNIYLVSHGNECDWLPALLDDGRVVYSRWEYTDKPLWRIQSLWTVNPDGTGAAVLWGNQSVWPDHLAQPRPMPGTGRVMFTAVGHHDWFAGSIGIVAPDVGREYPQGLTKVTTDVPWPEVGNGPGEERQAPGYEPPGPYDAYQTPYPLGVDVFLVSARRSRNDRFRLYLMDVRGNAELLHEGEHNIWHAMPVKPRVRPPVCPDRVAWPGTGEDRRPNAPGRFYSPDVCEGVPGLPRAAVKHLRVFQQDYTTFSTGSQTFRWSGPGISIVQEDAVKRILGTVPVHADGSVYFEAPAGRMLYFQLLDERYRALHTMRSFTGVMPGERRGCVGCHEQRSVAPPVRHAQALRQPPARIQPPPWGDESIGYERFVQPVLDRYCGKCHQGDGKARKALDLTLRPGYRFMQEPYLTLVGPAIWTNPKTTDLVMPDPAAAGVGLAGIYRVESYVAEEILGPFKWYNGPKVRREALEGKYATLAPMTGLSYGSPLVRRAMSGQHHGVTVDPVSLRRLIAWVDAMGPYRGEPEVRAIPDPDSDGIEEFAIRPRTRTAPHVPRP